jgi:hypothetical protein
MKLSIWHACLGTGVAAITGKSLNRSSSGLRIPRTQVHSKLLEDDGVGGAVVRWRKGQRARRLTFPKAVCPMWAGVGVHAAINKLFYSVGNLLPGYIDASRNR